MKQLAIMVFCVLMPALAFSQTMDDANLKKLQEGGYSLEPGKVQVTFTDTVSRDFAEKKMTELGYEMLSSTFQNIILSIENNPEPGQLNEIESLDFVDFIMSESAGIKDEDIEEMSRKDTVDSDRINTVLTQLNQTGNYEFIIVGLTYSATEERVDELRKAYPKLEILVEEKSQRMAILKTEEEKELEAMDELMKLSFVKNTAMVGVVEQ
jgi:hypothetical protein